MGLSGQAPNWQTITELIILAAPSVKNKMMTALAIFPEALRREGLAGWRSMQSIKAQKAIVMTKEIKPHV